MIELSLLRNILKYDPETGLFFWLVSRTNTIKIGQLAGSPHNKGYWQISINGKKYLAHRLAWFYMTGEWPNPEVDHEDLNKRNNKFSNLREATRNGNVQNVGNRKNNTSGFKGVSWNAYSKKWMAQIQFNKTSKILGHFDDKESASICYSNAAKWYHGKFGRA